MIQVTKIHNVLGTPTPETLNKLKKHSNSHIDFNFPPKEGTPLQKLLPHCSAECVELITKLLAYDPDDRISARQAVKHPYFRDFREADKRATHQAQNIGARPRGEMRGLTCARPRGEMRGLAWARPRGEMDAWARPRGEMDAWARPRGGFCLHVARARPRGGFCLHVAHARPRGGFCLHVARARSAQRLELDERRRGA